MYKKALSQDDFYAAVVDDYARKDPNFAIGSSSNEHWDLVGKMQFDYLIKHGMSENHQVLDIGCGNLRAGRHIISHLNPGGYTGVDISKNILKSAVANVSKLKLQPKRPYLYYCDGSHLDFLPENHFDIINAHSVFSHMPYEAIVKTIKMIKPLLKDGGFFDFTYFEDNAKDRVHCSEDYYYTRSTILAAINESECFGRILDDWKYIQMKMRVSRHEK